MHYVSGYLFNRDRSEVLLLQKIRPSYLNGLLAGVGGKIEPNETSRDAMIREFGEETDGGTQVWHYVMKHVENDYDIVIFAAVTESVRGISSKIDEQTTVVNVRDVVCGLVPNMAPHAMAFISECTAVLLDGGLQGVPDTVSCKKCLSLQMQLDHERGEHRRDMERANIAHLRETGRIVRTNERLVAQLTSLNVTVPSIEES